MPLQSLNSIPNNLPIQVTSFVGRENEIAEVKRLLATTRVLTLTGSGGTGKTRLSLQVAAEVLDLFPDGVWFVELAPLTDPAFVAQTVATALGVHEQPGRPMLTTLTEALQDKQLLVILDNCEHLIEACARLADTLQRTVPQLEILVSSREALGIAGETSYSVPSLPSPNPSEPLTVAELERYTAVQLFVARALAVKMDFGLNSTNAHAVAQICFRLDGIPLAIELAASRVKALSVEQIAARLNDRFRLLTGGSRTALPRQQTLRGAIDWSYSLLSEPERILYRRLSVFSGGWTLEAAEAVCAGEVIESSDVLDLLAHVVDKSLVVLDTQAPQPRYRMLETIRQYARDKLLESGEGEQVRNRHVEFFVRLADTFFDARIRGPKLGEWLTRLETDLDNLRAAIDWALETRNAQAAMRLVGSPRRFWFQHHPAEAIEFTGRVLSMPEAAGRSAARARALSSYGWVLSTLPNHAAARNAYEEALDIAREVGDEWTTIYVLIELGLTISALGDNSAAQSILNEGMSRARRAEDQFAIGYAQNNLGDVAFSRGDVEAALTWYEQSVTTTSAAGAEGDLTRQSRRLGQIALQRGDYEQARELIGQSLKLNMGSGQWGSIACCLAAFAALWAADRRPADAVRMCGTVTAHLESHQTALILSVDRILLERTLTDLRNRLEPALFDTAWAAGRKLTFEQAIALALEQPPGPAVPAPAAATPSIRPPFGVLSAREREVAVFVARGKSNRAIADELVLSERTIEGHVRNLLSKLGFNSRSQIAAWAVECGLTTGVSSTPGARD